MKLVPNSRFLIHIPDTNTHQHRTRNQKSGTNFALDFHVNIQNRKHFVGKCIVIPAFELLKQNTLSLAANTTHRGCHGGTYCITFRKALKHVCLGKTDQFEQLQCSCGQLI